MIRYKEESLSTSLDSIRRSGMTVRKKIFLAFVTQENNVYLQGVPQSKITALLQHQEVEHENKKPQNVETQEGGHHSDLLPLPLVR